MMHDVGHYRLDLVDDDRNESSRVQTTPGMSSSTCSYSALERSSYVVELRLVSCEKFGEFEIT
jgi:hypothetical protein